MIKIENTDVMGWEAAIRGFPEYRVTKDGHVIGKRGKPMKGHVDRCGYREVILSYYPNLQKQALVHRLILSTFNPIESMENYDVNHKLDEWHTFCDWIKTLPYSEIITGEQDESK